MPHSKIAEARWNSVQQRLKKLEEELASKDKQIKLLFKLVKDGAATKPTDQKALEIFELSLNPPAEVTKYISWLLVAKKLTADEVSEVMDYIVNFVNGHKECI